MRKILTKITNHTVVISKTFSDKLKGFTLPKWVIADVVQIVAFPKYAPNFLLNRFI